jgi:hypothetical protein
MGSRVTAASRTKRLMIAAIDGHSAKRGNSRIAMERFEVSKVGHNCVYLGIIPCRSATSYRTFQSQQFVHCWAQAMQKEAVRQVWPWTSCGDAVDAPAIIGDVTNLAGS